jgi:hypothetical protein
MGKIESGNSKGAQDWLPASDPLWTATNVQGLQGARLHYLFVLRA